MRSAKAYSSKICCQQTRGLSRSHDTLVSLTSSGEDGLRRAELTVVDRNEHAHDPVRDLDLSRKLFPHRSSDIRYEEGEVDPIQNEGYLPCDCLRGEEECSVPTQVFWVENRT